MRDRRQGCRGWGGEGRGGQKGRAVKPVQARDNEAEIRVLTVKVGKSRLMREIL